MGNKLLRTLLGLSGDLRQHDGWVNINGLNRARILQETGHPKNVWIGGAGGEDFPAYAHAVGSGYIHRFLLLARRYITHIGCKFGLIRCSNAVGYTCKV